MYSFICRAIAIGLICYSVTALGEANRSTRLLDIVRYVCLTEGCSVTSWIRTPKRNKRVGGVPHSKHLSGLAVDLVPDSRDWKPIIHAFRIRGLKVLVENDHLHVQVK